LPIPELPPFTMAFFPFIPKSILSIFLVKLTRKF
jgi:hypothetical protein